MPHEEINLEELKPGSIIGLPEWDNTELLRLAGKDHRYYLFLNLSTSDKLSVSPKSFLNQEIKEKGIFVTEESYPIGIVLKPNADTSWNWWEYLAKVRKWLLKALDPTQQEVFELYLSGHNKKDIVNILNQAQWGNYQLYDLDILKDTKNVTNKIMRMLYLEWWMNEQSTHRIFQQIHFLDRDTITTGNRKKRGKLPNTLDNYTY